MPVSAAGVGAAGVIPTTTPIQGLDGGILASLDEFLASSGIVEKSEVVRSGFRFLTGTKCLTRDAALTVLAGKIKVRSVKAVHHYIGKDDSQEAKPQRGPGRPPIVSEEKIEMLKQWVASEYASTRYVTFDDIFAWTVADGTMDYLNVNTFHHTEGSRSPSREGYSPGTR